MTELATGTTAMPATTPVTVPASLPAILPAISTAEDTKLALNHVLNEILDLPLDSHVRSAFKEFWINNIHDLMNCKVREDLTQSYSHTTIEKGVVTDTKHVLPTMLIRNIELLQLWYRELCDNNYRIWFNLYQSDFQTWKNLQFFGPSLETQNAPKTTQSLGTGFYDPITSSDAVSFQRSIKRSPNDYNKFKDDTKWKQWHRHLKATANCHGLNDVLNPFFTPMTPETIALFQLQNTFMYSVFEQCLQTTKSKHVVQVHDSTANAQLVYADLLTAYEETLTTTLAATDLRSELTLMRFDDTWKKGSEAFLEHWVGRVLELEQLEDKAVDPVTKRLWLTTTLSTKAHMANCITQAQVTEKALLGMLGGSTARQMPWDNFYNLVMAQAKMLDHTTPVKATSRQTNVTERGAGWGDGCDNNHTPWTDLVQTTVSGPNMAMKANMTFTSEEYNKLTHDQKVQFRAAKGKTPWPTSTPNIVNNTTITPTVVTNSDSDPAADSHLRQVISNRNVQTTTASDPNQVTYNGQTYQRITNTLNVTYIVNNASRHLHHGSLIDGGANGGMSGDDVRVIEETLNNADVSGLADHSVTDLPIATVAGVLTSSQGNIIGIFHQYAHLGTGKTIHSANQMRHFGVDICDTPTALRGKQQIHHPDGYVIPLSIRNGLAYMDMHPPTDSELETLTHVFFTSDTQWDPRILDSEYTVEDLELDPADLTKDLGHPLVDIYGEFINRKCAPSAISHLPLLTEEFSFDEYHDNTLIQVHNHVTPKQHDFTHLKPNFGFIPVDTIQQTIENTTQYSCMDNHLPLRKHFKACFPDTKAYDDGLLGHGVAFMVQLFCGTQSLITAVFPMCIDTQMPATLLDFICKWGAPNDLFSNNAKVHISQTVNSILRMYCTVDLQSEPHHQHQNPAECHIQDIKKVSTLIMDRTGTPVEYWLLSSLNTAYILTRLATKHLSWFTHIHVYFVPTVGRVTQDCSKQVIYRSAVPTALDPKNPNLNDHPLLDTNFSPEVGEINKPIHSMSDLIGIKDTSYLKLPKFSPKELIGITFTQEMDDGKAYYPKIEQKILDKASCNPIELTVAQLR